MAEADAERAAATPSEELVSDAEMVHVTSSDAQSSEVIRKAGRGGLAVAFAKVYFIAIGLAQQIALKHVLGLDRYGALASALSIASIAYNPIVSTSIQGVSRAVAQVAPSEEPATVRRTLMVHGVLALLLAGAFAAVAPWIGRTIGAPHVVSTLELLSAILLLYGLYTPLVGVLNGRKKFTYQAGLDILAATLRTTGLVVGAWWVGRTMGRGVEGAVLGFIAGASVVLVVALSIVGIGRRGAGGPSAGSHLSFIAPLLLGQTLLNLLFQADLTLLRAFAADAATRAGLPVQAADPLVGAYRATQLFCFLPYQLLLSVTFILFPMLAAAHKDHDRGAIARYVRTGMRLSLLIAGLMVSVTSALSEPLLRLVFGADAAGLAARPMQLLSIGFGAFAIFGTLTTVLNSLGRERSSAVITAVAFALVVVLCFVLVRGGDFGRELLWRTAIATSMGLGAATLVAALLVRRAAGAVVGMKSFIRMLVALGVALAIGRLLPTPGTLATILHAALLGIVYLFALIVLGELGRADFAEIKNVIGPRGRAGLRS